MKLWGPNTVTVPCDFEPFLADPALTEEHKLDRIRCNPVPYESRARVCPNVLVIDVRDGDEAVRAARWRGYGCNASLCPAHSESFECKGCRRSASECSCPEILVGDRTGA